MLRYKTQFPEYLFGKRFTRPGKVARVQSECTELYVSAANSYTVDSLGPNLCLGSLTAHLKLSLLAVVGAFSTSGTALVTRVSGDSHVVLASSG